MPTLAVAAHKGGVGKTAVAVNLAACLAQRGRRVLLVDCDPQGAAGAALGIHTTGPTLNELLFGTAKAEAVTLDTGRAGLFILPATLDLAGAEVTLPRRWPDTWQTALRVALRPLTHQYDALILDTPPGLGVLPFAALVAAGDVLITCPPSYLAYRALPLVLETIDSARKIAPPLRLLGIVPTMAEHRSRHEREVMDALAADYPGQLLPSIPRRIAVQDAQLAGVPLCDFAPGSDAARAFDTLTTEVQKHGY